MPIMLLVDEIPWRRCNVLLLQFDSRHDLLSLRLFYSFSSAKTQGAAQKFGQILAIWVFILAAFFPVMGAYVTSAGLCP
jgi:hypothetical protein